MVEEDHDSRSGSRRNAANAWLALTVVAVGALLCLAVFFLLPRPLAAELIHEGGLVEAATVAFYFAAALCAFGTGAVRRSPNLVLSGILLTACGLRELDFHTRFTSMGIMKSRYYLSAGIPWWEKTVSGVILIGLAIIGLVLLARGGRAFWKAIKRGSAAATAALLAVMMLPVSKMIDRAPALIRDHAPAPLMTDVRFGFTVLEECMELAIPMLFLWALLTHLLRPEPRPPITDH